MLARTINIPANHLKQEDWISLKKTNLLMAARSRLVEYAIRGGIFLALIYQSNIYQATVWLAISICIDLLIAKETKRYNQHATDESTIAVNAPMVVRYQYYWYLNALWFGLTSLIFSAKQDVESQMVMISLLNFITLVGATRNIADGKFCQNILFVFAFSQIVGIVWNIVVVFNFSAPNLHFIYIVFLFFQYSVMMKNSKFFPNKWMQTLSISIEIFISSMICKLSLNYESNNEKLPYQPTKQSNGFTATPRMMCVNPFTPCKCMHQCCKKRQSWALFCCLKFSNRAKV